MDLGGLVPKTVIDLKHLSGKSIAIDAYNALYQFLSIIRQPNGTPLMDKEGRVTSHLSGLFYRTVNLLEIGIFPAYVFDGIPPALKEVEIKRRAKAFKCPKCGFEIDKHANAARNVWQAFLRMWRDGFPPKGAKPYEKLPMNPEGDEGYEAQGLRTSMKGYVTQNPI